MKFFSTPSIRELDQYTIEHEPIASIDLMERAAQKLYVEVLRRVEADRKIVVVAGPGNNGGDALALARMLLQSTFDVEVILLHTGKLSVDCETNRQRLLDRFPTVLNEQTTDFKAPTIENNSVIIDGLFGSGLTRPLSGIYADAVEWINDCGCEVLSIDIPSGLQGEENPDLTVPIVKANTTFSLQFPKLAFLFPENAVFVGHWEVLDIGILPEAILSVYTNYYFLRKEDIAPILRNRPAFSHKGTFGRAFIVAGSNGMAGAAVLASKAALRSGAGLVTLHGNECNRTIVQTAVPEVIFHNDANRHFLTNIPSSFDSFNSVAIGPGIGVEEPTVRMLSQFLKRNYKPCILDADALNIISKHPELLDLIPQNSILTPHPKEFERLFGTFTNSYNRVAAARDAAIKLKIIIILKGAYTLIATPDCKLYFNSTGNSGMATAGSGDVLTGILAGLLAQGYSPEETAKLGVFLHGYAADLALNTESEESLIASDIICHLGEAFRILKG
ncbi:MAG: NAD(P)H-hydrate dehydratase [Paludibacter sp.]|nr:NAD(P)H-hydrate dehydratase [Paludibacter sp.]